MLPPKVVAAVVFIWVIASLLGGLYELSTVDASDQALINKILFYRVVTTEGSWGPTELVAGPIGWVQSIWELATFQFSFITGDVELVRWIIFAPLSAMVVYGMVMMVVSILRGQV